MQTDFGAANPPDQFGIVRQPARPEANDLDARGGEGFDGVGRGDQPKLARSWQQLAKPPCLLDASHAEDRSRRITMSANLRSHGLVVGVALFL